MSTKDVAGYVNEAGERIIYSSAISDQAGKAYTLLCVAEDLFSFNADGKVIVGPDGETPHPKSEMAAAFMVGFMQVYGRPWGNDKFTRDTWVKDYRVGVEELASLGIVDEPRFTALGQPETNGAGFPIVTKFYRHRLEPGAVDLSEG